MANGFQDYSPDWWKSVLKESEPAQYYSDPRGIAFGQQSPRKQQYFYNAYDDIMKDYIGQSGSLMRMGESPMDFMDFLETDPWTARYSALSPAARGVTGIAANPRTRFLFNF